MTPPADLRPLPGLLVVMLLMSLPAAALEPETCFSRQHQGAAINVRVALSRDSAAMMARMVRLERDCVLACCSEEVRTGARCNMAVFKANKHAGEDNCLLFHCPTESDCPLMKAAEGSNTYDIYKGLLLFRFTCTEALHSTPEPSPPIIIIATEPAGSPPTTNTTTTTTGPSPTFTTRKPNKTSKKQNKTTKKGKSHPALTTTTTTQTAPSSMTSLPAETGRKEVEDKHTSVPETTTSAPTTTMAPTTSTTTTTPTTTATFPITTTTLPPTTTTTPQHTSTTEPTTTVTAQPPSLIFIPKDPVQSEPDLQPGHPTLNSSSSRGKAVAAQGALKGGVVAFMVLALAVLTLALAVGGRKAMESFDRRHYTRLELNDLHYEI
uniref:MANSC domain containing 1 n=1 Tax=Poecilia reticulata TaxID=8081 RepID=A0A3P9Q0H3_POERE